MGLVAATRLYRISQVDIVNLNTTQRRVCDRAGQTGIGQWDSVDQEYIWLAAPNDPPGCADGSLIPLICVCFLLAAAVNEPSTHASQEDAGRNAQGNVAQGCSQGDAQTNSQTDILDIVSAFYTVLFCHHEPRACCLNSAEDDYKSVNASEIHD